ncbi:ADP-ribosylation factor-like protein 16 [Leptinotarsa decemlineata]|uniref:ADP-ribosylation factor-like protein 16 n=1 Tax=Leptinotarsa decemlineata TaxID=7539 RepID=UPI003D30BCB5
MIVCLGPMGAGKTLLLKSLRNSESIDNTTTAVPTVGTNIIDIKIGDKIYTVRELGGTMAPMWNLYLNENVRKVIFVVDVSDLCQISAACVLLYTVMVNPCLRNAQFLIALTKMDVSYRQMRNEALLMLQMKRLQKEVRQSITITESSAITGEGRSEILKWISKE